MHPSRAVPARLAVTAMLLLAGCVPGSGYSGPSADPASEQGRSTSDVPDADVESCADPAALEVHARPLGQVVEAPAAPVLRGIDMATLGPDTVLELVAGTGPCPTTAVAVPVDAGIAVLALAAALAAVEGHALVVLEPPLPPPAPAGSDVTLLRRRGVMQVLLVGESGTARDWGDLDVVELVARGRDDPAERAESDPDDDRLAGLVALARVIAGRTGAGGLVVVEKTDLERIATLVHAAGTGGPLPLVRPVTDEATLARVRPLVPDLAVDGPVGGTPSASIEAGESTSASTAASASGGEVWLGDVESPHAALGAAVIAAARGAAFVAVAGSELRAGVDRTEAIRTAAAGATAVVLVGEPQDHAGWQLATVVHGTPLPGGGFLPLEGRRIVALYGSPGSATLGALGQQDLDETVVRAREYAQPYGADGLTVVPGFDMIVTIASSRAEPTGDYSRRVPVERLRPYVDRAREEGFAVLLDLQPGRTSFLEQAKEYEELLREPHVHLALDPEWRIGPQEVHLRRIGSVEAAEVQEVADWLAELVRSELLPQKVLMLHQFVLTMLPGRETIAIPPELVGVVHVDGFGSQPAKRATYRTLTTEGQDRWVWGWKQFLRQDRPLAAPEVVLALDPAPVVITYQ